MKKNTNHKERFKAITAVHLLLFKGNSILLMRRHNTGYKDGQFSVPAGHIEAEETATQAAVRELWEEVGVVVMPTDMRFAHVMHRTENYESLDFFFASRNWEGTPEIREPDKCSEIGWFPVSTLPSNTVDYVKTALARYKNGLLYSEFGWENA